MEKVGPFLQELVKTNSLGDEELEIGSNTRVKDKIQWSKVDCVGSTMLKGPN